MTLRGLTGSFVVAVVIALLPSAAPGQSTRATAAPATSRPAPPPRAITGGEQSKPLTYLTDSRGDRVPDYSYAGYRAAAEPIPDAPARVVVTPVSGDNTARIQAAIDYVSTLPLDARGVRGTVLLKPGRFDLAGGLRIGASGVILRGSGAGEDGGTLLVATGIDRRTLITIAGADDRRDGPAETLAAEYVPVNATRVRTAGATSLKAGDRVTVRRPCTTAWIRAMGMESMGGDRHGGSWKPGTRELKWDRAITEVSDDAITLDAPITASIDPQFGVGTITPYEWLGRVREVGVENLRCRSEVDKFRPKDEEHAWVGISMACAEDAWVRQVTFEHFVGGAVWLFDTTRRVTVEDCKSLAPVSENGGYRRNTFFTNGQQTLFQRCHSEEGRHDFSVGYCAAGPNAFVQCWAERALEDSGTIDSFAAGVLYDNVRIDGNALSLYDRRHRNHAAGWSAANSFLWQCHASVINCFSPPTAKNWAYGCWATFAGDGEWAASNEFVRPTSLYYAQLADRIGEDAHGRAELLMADLREGGPRSPEQQRKLLAASAQPARGMSGWIDEVSRRRPIPIDAAGAKSIDDLVTPATARVELATQPASHRLAVKNGWLVFGDAVAMGGRQPITWWNGGVRPHDVVEAAAKPPSPTRFVPGRTGPGLTQDLEHVADEMIAKGKAALDHHYGLWYDVRAADHERVRRMDGDVFPPFYEMPFARSGRELAWDGLSKYDLTTYNPWYFNRLKTFARIGERKGLLLFNQHFFQHNILEAGAHWSSSPWRTANNVNDTGFPEPPYYVNDKYILFAEQFYDVSHPARRALYRAYIRKNLDELSQSPNVVHLTSGEFQGPLHFVEFWLDVIGEWQRDTGKTALVGLSATKDVQDAILADPVRSKLVSVVDIQYWWYQSDGKPFAPPGGVNRAPRSWGIPARRQMAFEPTIRAVREYRVKYPDKAIVHAGGGDGAALMGGGSLCGLASLDIELASALVGMRPIDLPGDQQRHWALGDPGKSYLVYSATSEPIHINLPDLEARYQLRTIDPKTGARGPHSRTVNGGDSVAIDVRTDGPRIIWLVR